MVRVADVMEGEARTAARGVAAGSKRLLEGRGLGGKVVGGEGEGEPSKVTHQGGGVGRAWEDLVRDVVVGGYVVVRERGGHGEPFRRKV